MIRLLLAFFLFFVTVTANAESIPTIQVREWYYGTKTADNPQEVCDYIVSSRNGTEKTLTISSTGTTANCSYKTTYYTFDLIQSRLIAGCPSGQNYTLSGGYCVRPDCPSGQDYLNGVCVRNCTSQADKPLPNTNYQFSGAVSTWAFAGCKVKCKQRVITYAGGAGYGCTYTGASAMPTDPSGDALPEDPSTIPPEKPEDCLNRGDGYIRSSSGAIKCVGSDSAPAGQKPKSVDNDSHKEEGTDTDGDGKADKDQKTTDTNTQKGEDGKVKETKTESVPPSVDGSGNKTCPPGYQMNAGQTLCTKVTVTNSDSATYCAQNPENPVCKGINKKPDDPCENNKDRASCAELGTPEDGPPIGAKEIGTSFITPFALGSAASCPPDISGPKGVTIPFSGVCMYASGIRPIILALAWIYAGWMVIGAYRS